MAAFYPYKSPMDAAYKWFLMSWYKVKSRRAHTATVEVLWCFLLKVHVTVKVRYEEMCTFTNNTEKLNFTMAKVLDADEAI